MYTILRSVGGGSWTRNVMGEDVPVTEYNEWPDILTADKAMSIMRIATSADLLIIARVEDLPNFTLV